MKSGLIILMLLIMAVPSFAQYGNETITITTYYPSPHGVYGILTLYPRDTQPDPANSRKGDLYYDEGAEDPTNRPEGVYVFNGSVWTLTNLGGGGGASAGLTCEYINVTSGTCDNKCNSLGMECFDADVTSTHGAFGCSDSYTGSGTLSCKCCTLAPSTAPGAITTVSGTNPTCPSGTTEISRFITSHMIKACPPDGETTYGEYAIFTEGWKAPPNINIHCTGTYLTACIVTDEAKEACHPVALHSTDCDCSPLNWTMVKCQQN